MVGVLGAGDDNVAALNVPAENDLGRGLAVLLAKFCEQRLLQQRLVAMTQRIPRLRHDAVLLQEGFQFRLLMIGGAARSVIPLGAPRRWRESP